MEDFIQKPDAGKRARRRKDLQRMKARARKIYPHDEKARSANHLKNCSCWMCGNPRKYGLEPKISETRQEQSAMDSLEDITSL